MHDQVNPIKTMNIRALYYLIAVIGLCAGSFMLRDGMPLTPPSIGHIASVGIDVLTEKINFTHALGC